MRVGVIADRVPSPRNIGGKLGKCANSLADLKKTSLNAVAVEQIEDFGRGGRIGAVVKRKRNSGGAARMPQRWAK